MAAMLSRAAVVASSTVLFVHVYAQKRNNNVVLHDGFPDQTGTHISFASGSPVDMGQMPLGYGECSAAISDTSGNFLFATAHGDLFDRFGGLMDQGDLFMGLNGDATQGCLIFPRPGSSNVHDVLFIRDTPYSSPLVQASWVTVDMSLNSGLGGVTSNTIFGQHFTEKLTGTPHGNGTDYWAVMHEWETNAFRAYVIGENGLDTVPVVSNAGSPHTSEYDVCPNLMNFQGEMKLSYNGDRLALCNANFVCDSDLSAIIPSIVQLFHFNDLTGEVTYWMNLPGHAYSYGLDFSQDGSKLYVSGADPGNMAHYVDQYDLSGDTASILASRFRVYATPYTVINHDRPNAMAFAPDGRLYVSHLGTSLDAIQYPDLPGIACGYTPAFFPLSHPHYFAAHWNQLKRYHDSEYKRDDVGLGAEPKKALFNAWPNPAAGNLQVTIPSRVASPRLVVTDALGRPVREFGTQTMRSGILDVSTLANGLYTLTLYDGHTVAGSDRLVVHH